MTMTSKYPFKNLVFQGGGIKTFAYHGVVETLDDYGVLPQIERVAGTSAGAVMAVYLSFRLSIQETIELFKQIDYARIPLPTADKEQKGLPSKIIKGELLDKVVGNVDAVSRLLKRYGWYASDYPYRRLQEIIANYCRGNGRATFADFRARGFRDLYIVTTNLSKRRREVFSAETTPNAAVVDALLITQSIPLFFEGVQFDGKSLGSGDYYADGGVVANYPLHIFDDERYAQDKRRFFSGINWETLGARLYTPDDCPHRHRPITSLLTYMENLLQTLVEAQIVAFENSRVDQLRSINASDCCVQATDFHIKPDNTDARYIELVEAGKTATLTYLNTFNLPGDSEKRWLNGVLERLRKLRG